MKLIESSLKARITDMWYKVIANFENGDVHSYEVKGMSEAIKVVARLKVTSEVVYCKNHLTGYKILKSEDN